MRTSHRYFAQVYRNFNSTLDSIPRNNPKGALKLVGANKFADLTKRANETFEKENPKITQHQDGTLEGFSKSYDDNPLNKYDD